MIVGSIKRCINCGSESYVRAGMNECPKCENPFYTRVAKKTPYFHIKKENYEITREAVTDMYNEGMFSKEDFR